jgi:hypothetical protein
MVRARFPLDLAVGFLRRGECCISSGVVAAKLSYHNASEGWACSSKRIATMSNRFKKFLKSGKERLRSNKTPTPQEPPVRVERDDPVEPSQQEDDSWAEHSRMASIPNLCQKCQALRDICWSASAEMELLEYQLPSQPYCPGCVIMLAALSAVLPYNEPYRPLIVRPVNIGGVYALIFCLSVRDEESPWTMSIDRNSLTVIPSVGSTLQVWDPNNQPTDLSQVSVELRALPGMYTRKAEFGLGTASTVAILTQENECRPGESLVIEGP